MQLLRQVIELSKKEEGSKFPFLHMLLLFVTAQVCGALLAPLFAEEGMQAFGKGNETDILNPIIYIGIIILFTAIVLIIAKKRKKRVIKYVFLGAIALTIVFVITPIADAIINPHITTPWSSTPTSVSNVRALAALDDNLIAAANSTHLIVFNATTEAVVWSKAIRNITDIETSARFIAVSATTGARLIDTQGRVRVHTENLTNAALYPTATGVTFAAYNATNMSLMHLDTGWVGVSHIANISFPEISPRTLCFYNDTIVVLGNETGITACSLYPDFRVLSEYTHPMDRIVVGEIDGEAGREIVGYSGSELHFFRINNGNLSRVWKVRATTSIKGITLGDLDGDGIMDLVVMTKGGIFALFYNPDSGKWDYYYEVTYDYPINIDGRNGALVVLDRDGDGKGEIYIDNGNGLGLRYTEVEFHYKPIYYYYIPLIIGIATSAALTYALIRYPEWYVVDAIGLVVGAGAIAIFGISLHILPAMILLIILAVYDAISVYRTKHMVDLADNVIDLRLPILLIAPKKKGYSFKDQKSIKREIAEKGERGAMFMGLGDVIIPTILGVSAMTFLPEIPLAEIGIVTITGNIVVGVASMLGAIAGYIALMHYVAKGNPQAGLPLLNTGAILGYVIGYITVFQNMGLGIVW